MSEEPQHSVLLEDILRRRRLRMLGVVLALIAVLVAAGTGWWLTRGDEVEPTPTPTPTAVTPPAPEPEVPAAPPPPVPVAREPEPVPLPRLDDSDPLVRELAESLSSRPEVTGWVAPDELVRRFVASVDNVAEGRSPREQLRSFWPTEKFVVHGSDPESLSADAATYARYDALTDAFVQIDSRAAARAYQRLHPLFDEAYRDLGYPDRPFDDALRAAIAELLATPVVVGDPLLTPRVISYAYVDPDLEGLSGAQKQLLRLGPENAPRVQRKLREIARALGIPENGLPLTPIHQVASAE